MIQRTVRSSTQAPLTAPDSKMSGHVAGGGGGAKGNGGGAAGGGHVPQVTGHSCRAFELPETKLHRVDGLPEMYAHVHVVAPLVILNVASSVHCATTVGTVQASRKHSTARWMLFRIYI